MRNFLILCLKNSFNHVNFRIVLSNPYKIVFFFKFKEKFHPMFNLESFMNTNVRARTLDIYIYIYIYIYRIYL